MKLHSSDSRWEVGAERFRLSQRPLGMASAIASAGFCALPHPLQTPSRGTGAPCPGPLGIPRNPLRIAQTMTFVMLKREKMLRSIVSMTHRRSAGFWKARGRRLFGNRCPMANRAHLRGLFPQNGGVEVGAVRIEAPTALLRMASQAIAFRVTGDARLQAHASGRPMAEEKR